MEKKSYSLVELNTFIKRILALNFENEIWVKAEILSLNVKRGHYYLTLIQKDHSSDEIIAQINATIWSTDILKIKKINPDLDSYFVAGHEVLLQGLPIFHERFGLQFRISGIDTAFTRGALDQKKEELFARIQTESLHAINKGLELPPAFQNIAVISSKAAAGYIDFVNHIEQNLYGLKFNLKLFDTTMQGQNLEADFIQSLEKITASSSVFDAVIIIRGGGSKVDLAGFDNYNLAKIIANYPLPVFTGIGHEIDLSALDLVAHKYFKTPTAVAEYFIEKNISFLSEIIALKEKVSIIANQKVISFINELNTLKLKTQRSAENKVLKFKHLNEVIFSKIIQSAKLNISNFKNEISTLVNKIHISNPQEILKKGYILLIQDNKKVKFKSDLSIEQPAELHFQDGSITINLKEITNGKK